MEIPLDDYLIRDFQEVTFKFWSKSVEPFSRFDHWIFWEGWCRWKLMLFQSFKLSKSLKNFIFIFHFDWSSMQSFASCWLVLMRWHTNWTARHFRTWDRADSWGARPIHCRKSFSHIWRPSSSFYELRIQENL